MNLKNYFLLFFYNYCIYYIYELLIIFTSHFLLREYDLFEISSVYTIHTWSISIRAIWFTCALTVVRCDLTVQFSSFQGAINQRNSLRGERGMVCRTLRRASATVRAKKRAVDLFEVHKLSSRGLIKTHNYSSLLISCSLSFGAFCSWCDYNCA